MNKTYFRATYFQRETGNRGEKLNTESLAKPVIMRGSDGELILLIIKSHLLYVYIWLKCK